MAEEGKKKPGKGRIALIVILGILIVVLYVLFGIPFRDRVKRRALIKDARTYFETDLKDDLRACYRDFPLEGELIIETTSTWEAEGGLYQGYYHWDDYLRVTLETDASFDELSDKEINYYLKEFGWIGIDNYQKLMEKKCPGYFETWRLTAGLYDRYVYSDRRHDFYIRTPKQTYKDLPSEPDCYGLGRSGNIRVYCKEKESKAPSKPAAPSVTPRPLATYVPTPRPSKKASKPTDPYEAHLFDDPDDYADYYAEEFAEEIGEDADAGYEEAYDHWNYWHETYDAD